MKSMDKHSAAFRDISQVWEQAGLNYPKQALLYQDGSQEPFRLESDAEFKNLASSSLEKKKKPETEHPSS